MTAGSFLTIRALRNPSMKTLIAGIRTCETATNSYAVPAISRSCHSLR
jgi:hypothetical protein